MNSVKDWLLLFLLVIDIVSSKDPCGSAIDISNSKRDPIKVNDQEGVELCDSDLDKDKWYFLGGKITGSCVDFNRCSTFAGIWYEGQYPTGNRVVTGKVCAKLDSENCCGWSGTIKVRNCPQGYVYQLAIPDDCPMSYCVGDAIPCPIDQVYDKKSGICYDIPQLKRPKVGKPYISKSQMFGVFKATQFSIDCNLNSDPIDGMPNNAQLKVETVFRMNDDEVGRFVLDYPVSKVTLEESKLVGHIGKTLTCEAHLFYEFNDGSKSTKSISVKSLGYYFGIKTIDCNGKIVKELTMKQGVTGELYLRSTFPITFGHCVGSEKCLVKKYAFKIPAMKGVQQNDCKIQFENPNGDLVYKSSTPINIVAQITPGEEHSKHFLSFEPFHHLGGKTIFEGVVISPVQINVEETKKQPTCHSIGDPHFSSFTGITFDNYYTGDFNLLSTKHRTFQIQVRQIPCHGGSATCNCGMIAREGNSIIGINGCDYRDPAIVFELMKDSVNPPASLKNVNSNKYVINFVSGISIDVDTYTGKRGGKFLNIYVNGLKHEEYEGICSATAAPSDFNVYRISYAESFFKQDLPSCVNEIFQFPYCKCFKDKAGVVSVKCEFNKNDQIPDMVKFGNICSDNKREKRSADGRKVSLGGKVGTIQRFTLEDLFDNVNRSIDNITLPINELMPEEEAISHCLEILESFHFTNICIEFLGEKHDVIKQNCVDDVKITGSAEVAQIYLEIYKEVCMTTLAKEVTVINGEMSSENSTIIETLEEMNYLFPWMKFDVQYEEVTIIDGEMSSENGTIIETLEEMNNTLPSMKFNVTLPKNDNSIKNTKPDSSWSWQTYETNRYNRTFFRPKKREKKIKESIGVWKPGTSSNYKPKRGRVRGPRNV